MKKITLTLILGMAMAATISCAQSKQHSETIKKELQFEKPDINNVLYIANISGNIVVEGYDGQSIKVEVNKKITAKTEGRLQQGIEEISLGVLDRYDTLIVYMKNGCGEFSNVNKKWKSSETSWGYNWNNCELPYDYQMDFVVKVPRNLNLYVSTINDGDVTIEGVSGSLSSHNINGSITLDDISSKIFAYTINGDVTLNFKDNPDTDSKFYTLNGDINANFQPNLSADMSFKSFNGEFYTNLSSLEYLPSKLETVSSTKGNGVKYKLSGKTLMRTRSGGVKLDFETFNGDVYVKEIN